MKAVSTKIAVGSSMVTFVLVFLCTYTSTVQQKETIVATPTQSVRHIQKRIHEDEVFEEVFFTSTTENECFPEIQDREPIFEDREEVVQGGQCPFISMENNVVIDFTKNGTVLLPDLIMYADRESEDAVRTQENISIQPGVYRVQLASFVSEGDEATSDSEFEQQWYLELYDQDGDVLSTTKATRDMQNSEVHSTELVEHALVVPKKAFSAHAVHFAYKDTKEQKITPICALLTLTDKGDETQEMTLSTRDTVLFTASALLQKNTKYPNTARPLITVLALVSVLFTVLSLALFSVLHERNN